MTHPPSERGVATLSSTLVIVAVCATALVILQIGLVMAAKHRVQAAADLAALAGSSAAVRGGDACTAAISVARRNASRLERCRVDLAVVTVRAAGPPRRVLGVSWRARADARAAPSYYVNP